MGMDWWLRNPDFTSNGANGEEVASDDLDEIAELKRRIAELEQRTAPAAADGVVDDPG